MAFPDPQTVTVNAVPKTLNRVSTDPTKSIYATSDGNTKLTISHQVSKDRTRHMARLDQRVVAADPLSAENAFQNLGVYVVIDEPNFGFADADIDYNVAGLVAWLTSANTLKILGMQT